MASEMRCDSYAVERMKQCLWAEMTTASLSDRF